MFWQCQRTTTCEPLWAILDGNNETLLNQAIECYTIYEGDAALIHLMWEIESYRNFQQWVAKNMNKEGEEIQQE